MCVLHVLFRDKYIFFLFHCSELVMGSMEQQIEDRKERIKEKAQSARRKRILSPVPPR